MKICERAQCSFQNWYPKFRSSTIKSIVEPIPDDVLAYLRSDGVIVPREAATETKLPSCEEEGYYVGSVEWDSAGEDHDEAIPPSFPEFSGKLRKALEELGGFAFIKLNWSSPSDAAWIATNNSLKCSNLQDIYLLLKGSDKISNDLSLDYKTNEPTKYFIILKKWKEIHPGSEFRCFVHEGELIGISQRGKSEYFKYIGQHKYDIVNDIREFFLLRIKSNFPLTKYVFDVVRTSDRRVKVLDFGLFNDKQSDPYLFCWSELMEMEYIEGVSPEFRYIAEDTGIQPNMDNHFGIPHELTQLPEEERQSLIKLLQRQTKLDN